MTEHSDNAPKSPEDWRGFLTEYSRLFAESDDEGEAEEELDEEETGQKQRATSPWYGAGPADGQALAAAEKRLETRFPPSLRAFLSVSDGWHGVAGWIDRVLPCAEIDWFRNTGSGVSLIDLYPEDDSYEPDTGAVFRRALLVAEGEDFWLLDPATVDETGEWAAYEFQPKNGDMESYESFADLFEASGD